MRKEKTSIEVGYDAISHLLNKPHPMIPKPKVNNQPPPQNNPQAIPQPQKSNSNQAAQDGVLAPETVADDCINAIIAEQFLVLP